MATDGTPSGTYWATLPQEDVGRALMSRITECRKWLQQSGHGERVVKGWRASVGLSVLGEMSQRVQQGGRRGDMVKVVVSQVRSLVQGVESLVLGAKPAMQPVAANSDSEAREQALTARGVLDHVHRVHRRDALDKQAVRSALFMGEGLLATEWDAGAGKEIAVDPDTQQVEKEGDFLYSVLTPLDVYRDVNGRDWAKKYWLITRRWENKWELCARYPDKADEIQRLQGNQRGDPFESLDLRWAVEMPGSIDSDMVPIYTFQHRDCRAVPGGREVVFLDEKLVLTDGPLPYDDIQVRRIAPDETLSSMWGYTNVFDILGVNDVLNALYSAAVTKNTKFGLPMLVRVKGDGLQSSQLSNGATVLEVASEKHVPHAITFNLSDPELAALIQKLESVEEQLMGLNATSRGNPPGANMAAQALALLDAKAQSYNDSLVASFTSYLEDAATDELRTLKRYANTQRVATIAGKSNNWMLKSFTGEDLSAVDRVAMEPVAASSQGYAGKLALLEYLQKFGVNLKPQQVVDVATTGNLESEFESEETNILRIKSQCEELMAGKQPALLISDAHWQAIPEFLSVLDNPAARENTSVVNAVLNTVQEALGLWRSMPPDLLALRNGPPAPMGAPPGMPPPGMGPPGPPGPHGPPPGHGGPPPPPAPGPASGAPTADAAALGIQLPSPPPTQANGQPYMPPGAT